MSSRDELRQLIRSQYGAHHPDAERIRARFEAGVAEHLRARPASAARFPRASSRPGRDGWSWDRVPPRRLLATVLPTVAGVVVVCGLVLAVQSPGDPPSGPSTAISVDPPATPVMNRPLPPVTRSATATPPPSATPSRARPPAATTAVPAAPVSRCGSYDSVNAGPFVVANNLWAAQRGTGTQCVRVTPGATAPIGWSTSWDWTGGPGQAKSFASAVLGWRSGFATGAGGGLPVRLSDHRPVRTHWEYALTQKRPGNADVAYDVWFHTVAAPGGQDRPAAEMRVLLDRTSGGAAGSTTLGTFTIGGTDWTLYSLDNGWKVYSFVRTGTGPRPLDLDLTDFSDVLSRVDQLSPSLYVTSVQAGADVVDGAGALTTSKYAVTIG